MSTTAPTSGPALASASASGSRVTRPYQPRAPLVNQVDAGDLDEGIVSLLSDGIERALSRITPSLSLDLKPEVNLVLKLIVFSLGVLGPQSASPGAALQNLKLASSRPGRPTRPSRNALLLYLLLHPPLFPTYLLSRTRAIALSRQWPDLPRFDWRRKAWDVLVRVENAAKAWEIVGWLWFLWDRRYPSLLMRILKLQFVPSSPHLARMVSYEFMNRQLVWSVLTEFILFAFPRLPSVPDTLNPSSVVAPVRAFFTQPTTIDYAALSASSPSGSASSPSSAAHTGPCAGLPLSTCPVCYLRRSTVPVPLNGTDIALPPLAGGGDGDGAGPDETDDEDRVFVPTQTDCWGGCRYCYYCIAEELARQAKVGKGEEGDMVEWTCLRCGGSVTRAWRVGSTGTSVGTTEPTE